MTKIELREIIVSQAVELARQRDRIALLERVVELSMEVIQKDKIIINLHAKKVYLENQN